MAYLILVRHGQSEYNALGLWTGKTDVPLTEQGRREAREAAKHLRDITLHKAHTSTLSRAQHTLDEIKQALRHAELATVEHPALDERSYGDYTGKNKWDIQKMIGDPDFQKVRRSWDYPIPNGETLKDVHARVVPYYKDHILKDLKAGKNIIISAHGNSLRALMKHLENIDEAKVHEVEINTGQVVIYEIDSDGRVVGKTVRTAGGKA